ncbi:MAG TPA: lysophospholipid acyltransferase family protein [Longimicrobiales bacterium]|nr:lysophospholipid acyltransferase family protein [Longimicrobiales bacterium]
MTRRPTVRHRLEYFLVRGVQGLERVLGSALAGGLMAAAARLAYRPAGIRRDVVESHLRRAFPDREERWIRRTAAASYAHLGREGLSLLRLYRLGRADVLGETRVVEGLDAIREAVASGRGAVVVTGHFGNWEIGGAAVAARGIPLDVVVQRQANPLFDRLINDARARLGMRVIYRGRATREALRALRRGRVVAFVADQDAREAGIFVPFFGTPASTFRGPAVLALRSGAPVFIGTAVRGPDGRHEVRLRPIPLPPPGDPEERAAALTAAHVGALEEVIRAAPEQYFWHHRRWKTAPGPPSRGERGGGPVV